MDVEAQMFLLRGRVRPASYLQELYRFLPARMDRVLDLGCGAGELVLDLATRSQFVVGLDPSLTLLDVARQRQREVGCTNVGWVCARAEALPFADASFDVMVSVNVLRLTDKSRVLDQITRLIKPGGRLALKDHLKAPEPFGFWGTYLLRLVRSMPAWLRTFGPGSLFQMLRFRLSPAGVAQTRKSESLTASDFAELCTSRLAGCQVETTAHSAVVLWERG